MKSVQNKTQQVSNPISIGQKIGEYINDIKGKRVARQSTIHRYCNHLLRQSVECYKR